MLLLHVTYALKIMQKCLLYKYNTTFYVKKNNFKNTCTDSRVSNIKNKNKTEIKVEGHK